MARTLKAATGQHTVTDERGAKVTRVFHPSLDTYHDVPADEVDGWHEQGWTADPGAHNLVDGYPQLLDYSTDEAGVPVDEPTA